MVEGLPPFGAAEINKDVIGEQRESGLEGRPISREMISSSDIAVGEVERRQEILNIQKQIEDIGQIEVRPLPAIIEKPESGEALRDWHHKGNANNREAVSLSPVSVTPEYSTWEEKGAHKEYLEKGLDFIYQRTSFDGILKIIQNGATISAVEAKKKDGNYFGRSVEQDFETGGANSVFLSILAKGPGRKYNEDPFAYTATNRSDVFVEYDSDILDRLDWYAYNNDNFGSTREEDLSERPSPVEFFEAQNKVNNQQNEVCFPHAIQNKKIKRIVVEGTDSRNYLLERFVQEGVTHLNGQRIENIVVTKKKFDFDRSQIGKIINAIKSFSSR